jgi:heat shock protein HtpX
VIALKNTLYELREQNIRNTILFIIVFSLILFAVGYFLVYSFNWGTTGLFVLGVIIIVYNLLAYEYSDKIALASAGAIPADPNEYYELHNVVEEVALAAGIPKPKVYIMNEVQPNAFATGKNPQNASICVTTGLLQMMNREELQGVIAHEMSHIRNYDILLMTVVGIIAGLIIIIRDVAFRGMWFGVGERRGGRNRDEGGNILMILGLLLAIISPILVVIIRAAVSRQREFLADATGAYIVRDPNGLASALAKIGSYEKPMQRATTATSHMFISNPFGHVNEAFASHPPIEERIKRLLSLSI